MARLNVGAAEAEEAVDPAEAKPQMLYGIDVSKIVPYTTEAELPPASYRVKTVKGQKREQLVAKGAPRYYTQAGSRELIEVRRGFHKVERRLFAMIKLSRPQAKEFLDAIRAKGVREVY